MNMQTGPERLQSAQESQEAPSTRELIGEISEKFSTTAAFQLMQKICRQAEPSAEDVQQVDKSLQQYQAETQRAQDTVAANYFDQYRAALRRDYPQAFA